MIGGMEFRNAIFIVTNEKQCPIYNVGEEFKVEQGSLSVPAAKPICLVLVQEIVRISSTRQSYERFTHKGIKKLVFNCEGCAEGQLWFEFKKEREFATPQMKLLVAAERRRKTKHLDQYSNLLRKLDIFSPLTDDNLRDLSALFVLKKYSPGEVILKKGEPGSRLFIIMKGRVAVVNDSSETILEMPSGEIFGEMSLLSGEPVSKTVKAKHESLLAVLSNKDFRHVLKRYPDINVLFYKMLVDRATRSDVARAEIISSGMVGELADINTVELFQLINANQKTGCVDLSMEDGEATVLFHNGEIIFARYKNLNKKDAIFALLGKNNGHFTYTSGISEEEEKLEPIGSFMGLVMEGMQRLDEETDGETS